MSRPVLKIKCNTPPATWDIEISACQLSEKLAVIAKEKQEADTLSEPYILEGIKSMLFAKIVLYLQTYKNNPPPGISAPINASTKSILAKPQANIQKNLAFGSEDFKSLVEFQNQYKVTGLDDLIGYFVADHIQSMNIEEINSVFTMDQDFNAEELQKIDQLIEETSIVM